MLKREAQSFQTFDISLFGKRYAEEIINLWLLFAYVVKAWWGEAWFAVKPFTFFYNEIFIFLKLLEVGRGAGCQISKIGTLRTVLLRGGV